MTDDRFGTRPIDGGHKVPGEGELSPLLAEGKTPVVTGYIGATQSGDTPRSAGGSDLTGRNRLRHRRGRGMDLERRDGLMNSRPETGPQREGAPPDLLRGGGRDGGLFGAKALHRGRWSPSLRGIPVRFRNTFKPATLAPW